MPSTVVKELKQLPAVTLPVVPVDVAAPDAPSVNDTSDLSLCDVAFQNCGVIDADKCNTGVLFDESNRDVTKWNDTQKQDGTPAQCGAMARVNKGRFVICRGMLNHKVKYQPVSQLCMSYIIDDDVDFWRGVVPNVCLLYTSPSPRDGLLSRMPSSA